MAKSFSYFLEGLKIHGLLSNFTSSLTLKRFLTFEEDEYR